MRLRLRLQANDENIPELKENFRILLVKAETSESASLFPESVPTSGKIWKALCPRFRPHLRDCRATDRDTDGLTLLVVI